MKPTVTPLTEPRTKAGRALLAEYRRWFDAGGWAIEAEARDAARTDSLDVERLARALLDPHWQIAFHRWMTTGWSNTKNDEARPLAVKLAAEYAALRAALDKEPDR